ncbi:hypothetical protein ABZ357_02450 [Streptomyces sp. NPDC005917]|uniref:hypothetical protein n=1 Tax=unclassified Streptomyces TaxID=2593676 RepID=UPI00340EBD5E
MESFGADPAVNRRYARFFGMWVVPEGLGSPWILGATAPYGRALRRHQAVESGS